MSTRHGFALVLLFAGFGASSCGPGGSSLAIQNAGSDTMVNVAAAWANAYKKVKPEVSVEVSGGGSGVGISSLIQGTVDLANSSREMKADEIAQAKANTGKEAKQFVVGYDGLAVYVHRRNPLREITLEQLAGIYGKDGPITRWSQLGVDASKFCESDEIIRFSRQSNSGTYETFREAILGKGDFKLGSRDLSGSKDVVDAVGSTPCSIGYSGMGYKTDEVNFVHIATKAGEPYYEPTPENVISKKYPIARALYVYTLGEPSSRVKEYIDWILSPPGQAIVAAEGYIPVQKNP
jgi:phosphate transport system substrate-binding protein